VPPKPGREGAKTARRSRQDAPRSTKELRPPLPAPKKPRGGKAPPGAKPFASLSPEEKRERKAAAARLGHERRRAEREYRAPTRLRANDRGADFGKHRYSDNAWNLYNRLNVRRPEMSDEKIAAQWQKAVAKYHGRKMRLTLSGFRSDTDEPDEETGRVWVRRVVHVESYDDFLYALRNAIKAVYKADKKKSPHEVNASTVTLEFATNDDEDSEA
jgi:hypothetical protein